MRHWTRCRNLCLKLQKRVHLPVRGATAITDKLQHRDLLCYSPQNHSEPQVASTQLKRSLSYPFHFHVTPIFLSVDKTRSKVFPYRTVSRAVVPYFFTGHSYKYSIEKATTASVVTHFWRFHSTNSTSVCPPPTPSTQGQCLPSLPESDSHSDHIQIPDPPTNCCMSGCANCVWITYAQELAQLYKDSGRAAESVMNAIDDPSLKMFLNLELKEKLNSDD